MLSATCISHAGCPPGQEGHDAWLSSGVSPPPAVMPHSSADADGDRVEGTHSGCQSAGWSMAAGLGARQGERQVCFSLRCPSPVPPSPTAPSAAQPAPTCSRDDPSWPHTPVLDNRVSLIAGQGLGQGGGRRRGDTLGGLRELASEETWGAESGSGPG